MGKNMIKKTHIRKTKPQKLEKPVISAKRPGEGCIPIR